MTPDGVRVAIMAHPIIQRELLTTLRTRRALLLLAGAAAVFSLLVISRWPGNATVELSGARPRKCFGSSPTDCCWCSCCSCPRSPRLRLCGKDAVGRWRCCSIRPSHTPRSTWASCLGRWDSCYCWSPSVCRRLRRRTRWEASPVGDRYCRCTRFWAWSCCSIRPWGCWSAP